jgi:hypothetical protein
MCYPYAYMYFEAKYSSPQKTFPANIIEKNVTRFLYIEHFR